MKVMFDYAVHYRKSNGQLKPKVFKGRVKELAAGEEWAFRIGHSFRQVTTRVLYPGMQRIEPRLNGRGFSAVEFQLKV